MRKEWRRSTWRMKRIWGVCRAKVDGLAAKDMAAALLHTLEAIRLAQDQKRVKWRWGGRG